MKLPLVPSRTTPGFAFSIIERALQEGLGSRVFGQAEMAQVLAFFGADPPGCVYCGSAEVKRWDHLVPIAQGGETVLGNMVPACAHCDDSKQHFPFDEWLRRRLPPSATAAEVEAVEQRIARLQDYMQHFAYTPRPLAERLTAAEQEKAAALRARLQQVRKDMETLIKEYQEARKEG